MNDSNTRFTPTIIPSISNIIKISSGGYHSLLLNNIRNVYSFGWNNVNYLTKIERTTWSQ
jgi:alpha-tubulin suppressor-like RCC1 family protein